jgi:FRG domain
MKTININTTAELCCEVDKQFQNDADTTVIYRGLEDIDYILCPKAGRFKSPPKSKRAEHEGLNEGLMLELFRRHSVGLTSHTLDDDWEFLAVAQHHGMATRLMDWTRNPLVAAYFAVAYPNESYEKDERLQHPDCYVLRKPNSVIYAWRCPKIDLSKKPSHKRLATEKVLRYVPRHITPRIKAQSGLFSAHLDPKAKFCDPAMTQLIIPYSKRGEIKESLYRLGVHEGTIYPDLDGAARHIEWLQTDKEP